MANIDLVTANTARVVGIPIEQLTKPGGEALTALMAVREDPTTGKWTAAKATDLTEGAVYGVLTRTPEATGLGITALRKGVIDGLDLSGLDYGDPVYLSDTDGRLADAAGTVPVIIGRVTSAWAAGVGLSADKVLAVDVQNVQGASYAHGGIFISAEQTGTGSAQNVAHGLGGTPSKVLISPTELVADLAAGYDAAQGTHTSTNVVVTVTSGAKFQVLAIL